MKRLLILSLLFITSITTPTVVSAQGITGSTNSPSVRTPSSISEDNHTAREEQAGKEIWGKLQAKQVVCDGLSEEEFGALGEYFMGQMAGVSHEAMNTMMERMMGKEGEKQTHVVMGKRLSGCQPDVQTPQNGFNFLPMMWLMGSTGSSPVKGGGNPMMDYGWPGMMGGWGNFGVWGWLLMLIFWILLILSVVALIRYLAGSGPGKKNKTSVEILKERYARGEIDKKEFEEKKKDLT